MAPVQPFPSLVMKSGPGYLFLLSRYERIVFIGHTRLSVPPTYTLKPCLKGFVLDSLRDVGMSTVMSLSDTVGGGMDCKSLLWES